MRIRDVLLCFVFGVCGVSGAYADTRPDVLHEQVEQVIRAGQKAQQKADAWAEERAGMLSQIRDLKSTDRWLAHQMEKYTRYIEKQEKTIAELERRKKETEKIKMRLEPFLDALAVRLTEFVAEDLPFLTAERTRRLEALKAALNDYHLSLSDKARRVFEVLQVEANYGGNVERTEGTVELNGTPTQVRLFRLGRVALFYQTPDGRENGWFDRNTGTWAPLPSGYGQALTRAMEVADKKRTPVLLDLPVGGGQP